MGRIKDAGKWALRKGKWAVIGGFSGYLWHDSAPVLTHGLEALGASFLLSDPGKHYVGMLQNVRDPYHFAVYAPLVVGTTVGIHALYKWGERHLKE